MTVKSTTMSLEKYRNQLDQIDLQLLELIAKRQEVVERVADYKRSRGLPLFHRTREQQLLEARKEQGEALGIEPDLVAMIFRQLIERSHQVQDHILQKDLAINPKKIVILGGKGRMGRFFDRIFRECGHQVIPLDLDSKEDFAQVTAQSEVVIISVPINVTAEVIKSIAPHVQPGSLLMDFTSLKEEPVDLMLQHSKGCDVIGTHPMFGPTVKRLNRQTVVLCPARGEKWLLWLKNLLEKKGAEVIESNPKEHDAVMAVVQVLKHFETMVMGKTIMDLGVDLKKTLRFTSPIYRLELDMVGRLFSQEAGLYADIITSNQQRKVVLDSFNQAVTTLAQIVKKGDRQEFVRLFSQISDYFQEFKYRAMEESNYIIEKLVERA